MGHGTTTITLSLDSLRAIGSWAADCAERALPLYEERVDSDSRPRAAIEGMRAFSNGERRTARLRTLALEAYAALAIELDRHDDPKVGREEVLWAIEHAPPEAGEVLRQMPARQSGRSRADRLLYEIDAGIRERSRPENS